MNPQDNAQETSQNNVQAVPQLAPQNIYDNPLFFSGYKALRDNDSGLNGVLEIPALRAALPSLRGLHVLDLGCGFGDFARYARQQGAASVLGLDVSQKMLATARELTPDPAITYHHGAIEDFRPHEDAATGTTEVEAKPTTATETAGATVAAAATKAATVKAEAATPDALPTAFDLAVSSLALHYVRDYAAAVRAVYASLRSGGKFVFSVEHPIMTANPQQDWIYDASGQRLYYPLLGYQHEGKRDTRWFVDGVIKYHRTVQTYVNTLLAAGFRLERLDEPVPTAAAMDSRDDLRWQLERPPFLLIAAAKPD